MHKHGTLPDRVVRIGRAESIPAHEEWYESDVSLYATSNEEVPYAAMSHRWGDEQPLRLLRENLKLFQENIDWFKLPKTFQDAIVFARKLGIEFIWIDSLCIVQDSKEDWFEQSGKMAAIYEHAAVTLAVCCMCMRISNRVYGANLRSSTCRRRLPTTDGRVVSLSLRLSFEAV